MFFVALGGCALLALRPDARIERAFDVALAPTRVLAELCAPFAWLGARRVAAAEGELAQREQAEYAQRRELYAAERKAALPRRAELRSGRRFVHAEVLGRRADHYDQIELRIDGDSCAGLARDMPVTLGDAFVGRLLELDMPRAGCAIAELATANSFAIGAAIAARGDDPPNHCVVGGMPSTTPADGDVVYLALASPQRREELAGDVHVDESISALARYAPEAHGFELGTVERLRGGSWAIRPVVDFRAGLFQLAVVVPESVERAEFEPADELLDGRWLAARATSSGEPNPGREGLELALGSWNGARDGAALVVGARLLGRIGHAGALTSGARLLGDRGFAVNALAHIEGRDAPPVVLGRLVSRGRSRAPDAGGAIDFDWGAIVPLEALAGEATVRALLFTGSGDAGVPRGLLLGECELPTGPGARVLRVRPGVDARDVRRMWVRDMRTEPQR